MKTGIRALALLLLLALGAYYLYQPSSPTTSTTAPQARPEAPQTIAAPPKKRAAVPRPTAPTGSPKPIRKAVAPAQPAAPALPQAQPSGPVDRRENADPDAAGELAEIRAGMDLVAEDIGACISEWEAIYPALNGKVNVAFTLNADGLQEAWIMEATDIPVGPLSCFSAAVWGVEWVGVVRDPVQVTFPFQVSSDAENPDAKADETRGTQNQ